MTSLPRIYLASPLGFVPYGRHFGDDVQRRVRDAGLEPIDPFASPEGLEIARLIEVQAPVEALKEANRACGRANVTLIESCSGLLACLDGVAVDDGVAAEIGYAAGIGKPISAYRLDFRTAGDNVGTIVNLQIEWFVEQGGGAIYRSFEAAIDELRQRLLG